MIENRLNLNSKNILIQISGSIAAFKVCHVISKLVQLGHQVKITVSKNALHFVGESTLEGLSQNKIYKDTFESGAAMDHINLVRWADLILSAPATANYINKMAHGIGDDLLSTQFLAHDFKKPFLIAPAMNSAMYLHPVTQESITKLKKMGLLVLETESGVLACGEVGLGRLLDPDLILNRVLNELHQISKIEPLNCSSHLIKNLNEHNEVHAEAKVNLVNKDKKDHKDPVAKQKKRILITAGGTQEPIDSMRVITNLSTGATGTNLAFFLKDQGFEITLLLAESASLNQVTATQHRTAVSAANFITADNKSSDIIIKKFRTFLDLKNLLKSELENSNYDVIIHAAAVSDFHVAEVIHNGQQEITSNQTSSENKKIKSYGDLILKLKPNPKLISSLKNWSLNKNLKVIGFKYTATQDSEEQKTAVIKLFTESKVDAVVHNDHNEINRETGKHHFTFYDQNIESDKKCLTTTEIFQMISQYLFKN